jgi:ABC-type oligopeptide transport system ATPase subunit|tara:strand:- start:55 stop:252 length:198 start_codon:yes stop_codon:yes gene_type:complete
MTYWIDKLDKQTKDKAKQDLEILYKAKSIIINRINYDDDDCSFLRLQCHNDRFNKCIEIIEDELY